MAAPAQDTKLSWSDLPPGKAGSPLGRRVTFYVSVACLGLAVGAALVRLPLPFVGGALASLMFVAMILYKPFYGVVVYMLIFYLRIGEMYPALAPLMLEKTIGGLTLISMFIHQVRQDGHVQLDSSNQTRLLLLFVLAGIIAIPLAYYRSAAVDGVVGFLKVVVFYIMIVHLVDTRARLKVVVVVLCLATLWLTGSSLESYFTSGGLHKQGIDRALGTTSAGGNYNALGTTIASAFPLFLLVATRRFPLAVRLLSAACGVLMIVALVVTGSRASLLGFLAGMGWLWWQSKRRAFMAVLGLMLLIVGFATMPEQYRERYSTIVSAATGGEIDGSSSSRLENWKAGLQMVAQRPLFGYGLGNYTSAHYTISGSWLNSHSLYFGVLGELGLFGAGIFFAFLVSMLKLNRRAKRAVSDVEGWSFEDTLLQAFFAGFVALLVAGVFGYSLTRRTWYVYAAIDLVVLRLFLQKLDTSPRRLGTRPFVGST